MTILVLVVVGLIIAAVVGVLVARKNPTKTDAVIKTVEADVAKVTTEVKKVVAPKVEAPVVVPTPVVAPVVTEVAKTDTTPTI